MDELIVWWIGFIASILITLSMLPQLYKMWQLRHSPFNELHILWFIFGMIGSAMFLAYGAMIDQIGLIILNGVGLVSLVLMYLIYIGVWVEYES